MKTLTVCQPWASLIALGVKTIETRGWKTGYRGRLAIHAGKADLLPFTIGDDYAVIPAHGPARDEYPGTEWCLWGEHGWHPLALGAVVATADLTDCIPMLDLWPAPNESHPDGVLYVGDRYPMTLWCAGNCLPNVAGTVVTDQRPFGDFTPGRYAWILDNVQPLAEPIAARGRQGLWTWEEPT